MIENNHESCCISFSQFLQLVNVVSLLFAYRNILSDLVTIVRVYLAVGNSWVFVQTSQNLTEWIYRCGMSPCLVNGWVLFVLCTTNANCISLSV